MTVFVVATVQGNRPIDYYPSYDAALKAARRLSVNEAISCYVYADEVEEINCQRGNSHVL